MLGKKSDPHRDPEDPPRRRANKARGHGNYETDRPPIYSVKGRESGEVRYEVRQRSDTETCLEVIKVSALFPLHYYEDGDCGRFFLYPFFFMIAVLYSKISSKLNR
jgi:hypothetical protein